MAGVSKGSVLGPSLFSVYVADITSCDKNSKIQIYADEPQVYRSFSFDNLNDSIVNLNTDLQNFNEFLTDHNLKLNASKCCVMFFGK